MTIFLEAALQTVQESCITLLFLSCWKTSSSPLCRSPSLMIQKKRSPGGNNIIHSSAGNYLACLEPLISLVLTFLLQDTTQNDVFYSGLSLRRLATTPPFWCILLFFPRATSPIPRHTAGQHNLVAAAPHTTQLVTLTTCREHGSL